MHGQSDHQVRLDWGLAGARAVLADTCVVVDVLSFSTCVCVAVERGTAVLPHPWERDGAAELARAEDAVLATGRQDARAGARLSPSLSPAGLLHGDAVTRLVLPSPNGSSICFALRDDGAAVVAGCLRNARAVASWLAPGLRAGRTVAVVAAGERWDHDGSLRPALEDHLGAGAVVSHLRADGVAGGASPEALAAADLFDATGDRLGERLAGCASGRELLARGYGDDVAVAAESDCSATVPVLVGGAFVGGVPAAH